MKTPWVLSFFACLLLVTGQGFTKSRYLDLQKNIPYESLDELRVDIEIGIADLTLEKTTGDFLLEAKIHYKESRGEPRLHFDRSGKVGYLTIKSADADENGPTYNNGRGLKSDEERWELRFSSRIPTSFSLDLGLVDGTIDMSSLKITDLNISSGLSDLELFFDEPNSEIMNELKIECGLGDFNAYNLGNANFQTLRVESGLGSVTLDLSGNWRQAEAEMKVEVGLGAAKVEVPASLGLEVNAEDNFLSALDLYRDLVKIRKGTHRSENWESAVHRLIIDAEVGMGSLKVVKLAR